MTERSKEMEALYIEAKATGDNAAPIDVKRLAEMNAAHFEEVASEMQQVIDHSRPITKEWREKLIAQVAHAHREVQGSKALVASISSEIGFPGKHASELSPAWQEAVEALGHPDDQAERVSAAMGCIVRFKIDDYPKDLRRPVAEVQAAYATKDYATVQHRIMGIADDLLRRATR